LIRNGVKHYTAFFTAVDGNTNDVKNQIAMKALGTNMIIAVFDNGIKMKIGAMPEDLKDIWKQPRCLQSTGFRN
jgi:exopolysaccharide biosynthesis protein